MCTSRPAPATCEFTECCKPSEKGSFLRRSQIRFLEIGFADFLFSLLFEYADQMEEHDVRFPSLFG
jgi:hypothetical protein